MPDSFKAAKQARKRRTKWWREHIAFAYFVWAAAFAAAYFILAVVTWKAPLWLTALGGSPSVVNLIFGTLWCAVGVWGIRKMRNEGVWTIIFALCFLGGVITLARAFGFA